MRPVYIGQEVYCRGPVTQIVTGNVLAKKRGLFGWKYLCKFAVNNVDRGCKYDVARWRYRVIPVKEIENGNSNN